MDSRKTVWWYTTSMVLLITLMLVATVLMEMAAYGLLSSVFHLVCSLAYVLGWQAIARRSPTTVPKYFLATSALRLMAAAAVMLVYCVVNRGDIESIKWFAIVFMVFYLVMLTFDAIFFAKVSNSN